MPREQKECEGVLFRNDRRETDNHPNARGSCTINGTKYWISAWTNTIRQGDKEGERYQSLKFTPADSQAARPRAASPPPAAAEEDDDIPF